jgi:hypothetical protein
MGANQFWGFLIIAVIAAASIAFVLQSQSVQQSEDYVTLGRIAGATSKMKSNIAGTGTAEVGAPISEGGVTVTMSTVVNCQDINSEICNSGTCTCPNGCGASKKCTLKCAPTTNEKPGPCKATSCGCV